MHLTNYRGAIAAIAVDRAIRRTSQSARAVSRPIRQCSASPVVRKPTQQSRKLCCLEADAHDYFGDYAINPDGSVLLKSGAIPYRIDPTRSSRPNPTGHAVWWSVDYGDWGITTFCFAPGAGG